MRSVGYSVDMSRQISSWSEELTSLGADADVAADVAAPDGYIYCKHIIKHITLDQDSASICNECI